MIISDTYRYVFIELPHTASTAIAKELTQFYDGRPILRKHSYIHEFERFASLKQKDYFVFGTIRNPLDERVSSYWKFRSDHQRIYSHHGDAEDSVRRASHIGRRRFKHIRDRDASFEEYFEKFCKYTYDSPISLRKKRYDKVMRYERIEQEFEDVLKTFGISPERRLPFANRTSGRERDFEKYYTHAIIPKAIKIFGPFMREWEFAWPEDWHDVVVPWSNQVGYRFWGGARRIYWRTISLTKG